MIPVLAVTLCMQPLPVSAMKMLPDASTATSLGLYNEVFVAATLSEALPSIPFPATVVITPVLTVTFRIRLL